MIRVALPTLLFERSPSQGMDVLLTNDDGFDSPGLHAVAEALEDVCSVTIVAPATDHSACGRGRSTRVGVTERNGHFVVDGTPADCVIVGCTAVLESVDLVIAGCNVGGNLGIAGLGHSGTVSAAVEACFLGHPAIAVSLAIPEAHWPVDADEVRFETAVNIIQQLIEAFDGEAPPLAENGYLNINVPYGVSSPAVMVTKPANEYLVSADFDGSGATIGDQSWSKMATESPSWPPTSDRGAIERENVSVSPLRPTHQVVPAGSIERMFADID